jgi:hypothetical protein
MPGASSLTQARSGRRTHGNDLPVLAPTRQVQWSGVPSAARAEFVEARGIRVSPRVCAPSAGATQRSRGVARDDRAIRGDEHGSVGT